MVFEYPDTISRYHSLTAAYAAGIRGVVHVGEALVSLGKRGD